MEKKRLEFGITLLLFMAILSVFSSFVVLVSAASYGRGRTDKKAFNYWTNCVELKVYHDAVGDPIETWIGGHYTGVAGQWVEYNDQTGIEYGPAVFDDDLEFLGYEWIKRWGSCNFYKHSGSPDLDITTWVKINYMQVYWDGKAVTWNDGWHAIWTAHYTW